MFSSTSILSPSRAVSVISSRPPFHSGRGNHVEEFTGHCGLESGGQVGTHEERPVALIRSRPLRVVTEGLTCDVTTNVDDVAGLLGEREELHR